MALIYENGNVRLYDAALPSFAETELARLYKNVFSSVARFVAMDELAHACAYVASEHGEVTCLLLFRREAGTVRVLNEVIAIDENEVRRFSGTVFTVFPSVALISFRAIRADIRQLPFPYQQFNCLEDIVLDLPGTADAYFSSLGKNMRASLKRYQKKIAADLPGFHYSIGPGRDASPQQLAAIVALSSARMASKKQVSAHTDDKTAQLIRLAKACGVVVVASIDDKVCAGVICTEVGGNFFMHVVAHDPAYDGYRIGKLCCYLSICDAIARGGKEYHFLWGRYEYKYRLLGVQRELDRLVVYRSRLRMALHCKVFFQTALRGHGRRIKRWLQDEQRRADSVTGALAALLLKTWQRLGWRVR